MTKGKGKEKKIKAWAVVWEAKSALEIGYEPNGLLVVEPEPDLNGERYKVKCKCHAKKGKKTGWHYLDVYAIFEDRKSALAWRGGNHDWKAVPVEIIIKLNDQTND